MSELDHYRKLARSDRLRAQQETLPRVKAMLSASADRWEYLARAAAADVESPVHSD